MRYLTGPQAQTQTTLKHAPLKQAPKKDSWSIIKQALTPSNLYQSNPVLGMLGGAAKEVGKMGVTGAEALSKVTGFPAVGIDDKLKSSLEQKGRAEQAGGLAAQVGEFAAMPEAEGAGLIGRAAKAIPQAGLMYAQTKDPYQAAIAGVLGGATPEIQRVTETIAKAASKPLDWIANRLYSMAFKAPIGEGMASNVAGKARKMGIMGTTGSIIRKTGSVIKAFGDKIDGILGKEGSGGLGDKKINVTDAVNSLNRYLETSGEQISEIGKARISKIAALGDNLMSLADDAGEVTVRQFNEIKKNLGKNINWKVHRVAENVAKDAEEDLYHAMNRTITDQAPALKAANQEYHLNKLVNDVMRRKEFMEGKKGFGLVADAVIGVSSFVMSQDLKTAALATLGAGILQTTAFQTTTGAIADKVSAALIEKGLSRETIQSLTPIVSPLLEKMLGLKDSILKPALGPQD